LRAGHVVGAVISFAGAGLIVTAGGAGFDPAHLPGYGLALICAVFWAVYSVVSRRFGQIPTASVTVFCLATALLSALAHLALEQTVWPTGLPGWAAVVALGLGPVGLAFFVWDVGVKKGDIQVLGVASYAAPLLSTLVLVAAGITAPTSVLVLAALFIAGGAALAGWASRSLPSGD
jgi:drug/metabolite transporter (DMT)-like permease